MSEQYFISDEAHRVSFEDGQWVDVKPELSQEDQDYIMAELVKVYGKTDVQMRAGFLSLLERSIIAWSFTRRGVPVLVTRDNISKLKTKYRVKVVEEIDRLNQEAMDFLTPKSGKE